MTSPSLGRDARVRHKIWIERDNEVLLSEWRVALLRGVRETGSLARSAERLEVPYRTAWQRIKELEERLGLPLLETESGGADGGGSRLTPAALDLIARFECITEGIAEQIEERMRAAFGDIL